MREFGQHAVADGFATRADELESDRFRTRYRLHCARAIRPLSLGSGIAAAEIEWFEHESVSLDHWLSER